MKSTIRDYKAEVATLIKELELIPSGTKSENTYDFKEVYMLLEKSKPSLMFYGIYNSGKSTLLNSIFGELKASVNDVPETHKVTYYPWNGYTLVDTPGLNGPISDQEVTLQEIEKHDVILFVIDDSDNFDSDVITKRIIEILNAKKPCMIVINKKNDSPKEKIDGIKCKMQKNIETLQCNITGYDFIDVDAKSAFKARIEGKKLLLEDSKIELLEFMIMKCLKSVNDIQLLRTPIDKSLQICQMMCTQFGETEENEELSKLHRLLDKLYHVKENVLQEFHISLQGKLNLFSNQIYQQAIHKNNDAIQVNQYEQEIQQLAKKHINNFMHESQSTLNSFVTDWKMELQISDMPDMPSIDNIPYKKIEKSKDAIDEILDIIEKLPIPMPEPTPIPIPIPLPVVAKLLKIAKELIFGSEQQEIPDIEELNRQQEEYVRKREQAMHEIRTQVDMSMHNFQQEVESSFAEQLEKAYDSSVINIKNAIAEQEGNAKLMMKKIDDVAVISSKLLELKRDITE